MERERIVEELKELVKSYISSGGSLDTPRENFPDLIRTKVNKIIRLDREKGIKSTINSVLEETGYKRTSFRTPITLEN